MGLLAVIYMVEQFLLTEEEKKGVPELEILLDHAQKHLNVLIQ